MGDPYSKQRKKVFWSVTLTVSSFLIPIIIGALWLGLTYKEVKKLDVTISAKKEEIKNLNDSIQSLSRSNSVISANNTVYEESFAAIKEKAKASNDKKLLQVVNEFIPAVSMINPHASYIQLDKQSYKFKLWVEMPKELKDNVSSVSYFFNHPSFKKPRQISTNSRINFEAGYQGWGCLENVIVTVYLTNNDSLQTAFNMCKNLQEEKVALEDRNIQKYKENTIPENNFSKQKILPENKIATENLKSDSALSKKIPLAKSLVINPK